MSGLRNLVDKLKPTFSEECKFLKISHCSFPPFFLFEVTL